MTPEELDALIGRHLHGIASADEVAALSHELATQESARQVYLRFARLHAALATSEVAPALPAKAEQPIKTWWQLPHRVRWLAAAAVFAALTLTTAFWVRKKSARPAFDTNPVAQFGKLDDCRWVIAAEQVPQAGDPLRAGKRLDLSSGSAAVHFASGAIATLLGPCIFEVTSPNSGFLTLGQVKVIAATPESKGFTVQTRTARVVDVGTEFVAAAAADGQSRVDVTSGEVYVVVDGTQAMHRLRTGDAFSVEAGISKVLVRIESGTGTSAFQFPTIEPPSNQDYADTSRGRAKIRVAAGRLHASGTVPSGPADVLLDGSGQSVSDSPAESAFFDDNASGLLLLDLGQPITVSKINTYSWHQNRVIEGRVRAVQKFTLYGYPGDTPPPLEGTFTDHGWVQLARVNSDDFFRVGQPIDRPAQQACSITGAHGAIGRYRYLLWQAEPTQTLNLLFFNNTFYAESMSMANLEPRPARDVHAFRSPSPPCFMTPALRSQSASRLRYPSTTLSTITALLALAGVLTRSHAVAANASSTDSARGAATSAAGSIEGQVKNAVTGSYLNNARITVQGTNLLAFTDESGRYRLSGVPAGSATIEVFYTGLDRQDAQITVAAGQTLQHDVALSSAERYGGNAAVVRLDPFTVSSTRETDIEAIAINEQRFAPNLKNVISTETLGDALGGSVGDFLRFLPGVASTFEGGLETEGVLIRGFPTNYAVVSFDGAPLASNALQGGRDFSPSRFSVNSVSRVEVTKVPLPSNPADTMSGAINLVSKSAFERSTAEFKYRIGLASTDDHFSLKKTPSPNNDKSYKLYPDVGFDYTLPISPNFGIVVTGLYSTTIFQYDTWYLDYLASATGTAATPANPYVWRNRNVEMFRTHQRHSGSIRLDWRPTTHSVLSTGYMMTFYDAISAQSVFTPTAGNNGTSSIAGGTTLSYTPEQVLGATGRGGTPQTYSFADNSSVTQNANIRYRLNDGTWKIESLLSHSDAKSSRRNLSRGFFNGLNVALSAPVRVNLLNIDDGRVGDFEVFDNSNRPLNPFDVNNYLLNTASGNGEIDIRSKVTVGELNVRRELPWFSFPLATQLGGMHRVQSNDERRMNGRVFTYNGINGSRSAAPFLNDIYYGDRKMLGHPDKPYVPWISPHKVFEAMEANPGAFTQTVAQERATISNEILDSKYIEETVSAFYLQAESRFWNNRVSVITGVRYEKTTDEAQGPLTDPDAVYERNANGTFARTPTGARIRKALAGAANSLAEVPFIYHERESEAKRSYHGYYPSLHVNFSASERLMVRGAYAKTYGRPNYANIIPDTSVAQDDTGNDGDPGLGRITYSNLALRPWTADNYDLSVEYYTKHGGVLSAGVFLKEVKDFFGTVVKDATQEDLELLGLDPRYLGWRVTTQFNSGAARVRGVEFNVRHSLVPFGSWGKHVIVFANATKLKLKGEELADFTGFLPKSVNWGFTVAKSRATFIAKWNYRGSQQGVLFPDRGPEAFRYPQQRTQLDLSLDYKIGKQTSLFFNARNVTNGAQEEHIYSTLTPDYAHEFSHGTLGRVFSFGVKGSF